MKRLMLAALMAGAGAAYAQTAPQTPTTAPTASAPVSAAKRELVQKILVLQQPGIENLARSLVEQPAVQMAQAAGRALQTQVAADKRDAAGKSIDADIRKYVDESFPVIRDRAVKLAPSTIGAVLEEKFSDDELKQVIAWLDSPINKKYQQLGPEMQNGFMQKLVSEARPVLDPKLQALEQKVRTTLGVPVGGAAAPAAAEPKAAAAPARKASGSK